MTDLITSVFYLLVGVCAHAGYTHAAAGLQRPRDPIQILFAILCALTLFFALSQAWCLQARAIPELIVALKLNITAAILFFIAFLWFIAAYSAVWPRALLIGLSAAGTLLISINLALPLSLQYRDIVGLRTLHLPWGEEIALVDGASGLGLVAGALLVFVCFAFALYALVAAYRRTGSRQSLMILFAVGFFMLFVVHGLMVRFGLIEFAPLGPVGFLGMIIVMSRILMADYRQRLLSTEQSARRAQAARERYRAFFNRSMVGMATLSADQRWIDINPALCEMLGYSSDELARAHWFDCIDRDDLAEHSGAFARLASGECDEYRLETRLVRRRGRTLWAQVSVRSVSAEDGRLDYFIVLVEGIGARKAAEQQLHLQYAALSEIESHLRDLLLNLQVGIVVHAPDTRIVFSNPTAAALLCLSEDQLLGKSALDPAWCFVAESGDRIEPDDYPVSQVLASHQPVTNMVIGVRVSPSPERRWLLVSAFPEFLSNGDLKQVIVNFHDITEQQQAEQRIWRQANYDTLTDLPNRRMVYEHLDRVIRSNSDQPNRLAVMFVDLDRFKEVNDTLGHEIGDALLQEVTRRMVDCVPDCELIGRLGGDEFIIVLKALDDAGDIERTADRLLSRIAEPYRIDGDLAYISASIGITLFPDDADDVTALLKHADQAMYAAKKEGSNRFHYYTPLMQSAVDQRMRLSNDLHCAVLEQQFEVYYQPIVDLVTGAIVKAEALIRWHHPVRGLVSPAEFIPIAEETGLIVEIGDWVFRRAANQMLEWQGRFQPGFQISINESPVQFRAGLGDPMQWCNYLRTIGLDPKNIVLEITESVLMDARDEVIMQLRIQRSNGIEVALDDFGTGYSSLSYLKSFDIDYVKIDRSFVRNLTLDSADYALCKAMVIMAHALGLKVVVEGVETQAQCNLVKAIGCDYAQGYLWSKPVPAMQFGRLMDLACSEVA
ncbi:Diguanylate cyclase/phosphodiesterase with PAS/PAC sensor(S) (modular protein) [Thiocapsa sp. KS1]|nr:EAL domain-containing protein [Thiocapsa sp. KS1]CRI67179.1 Diguanylate cyclase/phosphodiesterase with PAS/PAC sensor(S) (modular protein) [Thiocapsa sp. KS1]